MLWLALRFASLPLEVYARAAPPAQPLAVVTSIGAQAQIVACNGAAQARGIKPGMPPNAATALASDLRFVPRHLAAEQAALERIAAWAIQFTPAVSIATSDEVLLEIAGSLHLFGGLQPLWRELNQGLKALGYAATLACAPTPLAALWFARAGLALRLRHVDALCASLSNLPIEVTHGAPEALALLHNVGAKTVSDILALPRDGLARRQGQALLDDLDRALGKLADPRNFFTPPTVFKAEQPLPAPAHEAHMLLFAARGLISELCGYLAATTRGAQTLCFTFQHHHREPTHFMLTLVRATRDADHLTNVLREKLERTALPSPATAITLTSELLLPLASHTLSLLPDAGQHEEAATQLIERLRARLGDEAVFGLKPYADYRPEYAWRTCDPGSRDTNAAITTSRPLWLLARPRALTETGEAPYYEGRLRLLSGPERIESGWWDGHDVMRDYFVACNPNEALLWIYRERNINARWFLHGFFS